MTTEQKPGLSEELKPCPFCGADDAHAFRAMARTYRASCRSCGAGVLGDRMIEAIAAWNTRAEGPANPQGDVGALVEALEPFARYGAAWLGPDEEALLRSDIAGAPLTVGDLRRACQALASFNLQGAK